MGFSEVQAKELQDQAGKSILQVMGKALKADANREAFDSFGMVKFPGIIQDDLRKVVVDYAKGNSTNLELLEKVHQLIYDANIPLPTASILRNMRPGLSDAEYYERAKKAAEHLGGADGNGDLAIRDVAGRVAMWNALDPLRRRELTGSDANVGAPVDFSGRSLDPRTLNALPAAVRQQLTGSAEPIGSKNPLPESFKGKLLSAETFNSLPSSLKKQLTGSGGDIDPAQVEGLLFNGSLGRIHPVLLEGPPAGKTLEARLQEQLDYYVKDAGRIARIGEELRREDKGRIALEGEALRQNKDNVLGDLAKQTSEGVGLGRRIGSIAKYTSIAGVFMSDPIDEWADQQASKVYAIRDIERRISENGRTQQIANNIRDTLSFAADIRQYEMLANGGKRREADVAAIDYLDKYGIDVMNQYAPRIYNELTQPTGQGNFGRSGFERLKDNGVTSHFRDFTHFDADPTKRFNDGLNALKSIKKDWSGADVSAVRSNALRAIEADPKLNGLSEASSVINTNLGTLMKMYEAGKNGTKYATFVDDVKARAGSLEEAFKAVDNNPALLSGVKDRVSELQKALTEIEDPVARKNITEKINSLNDMVKILDPASENRKQMDQLFKMIKSRDFNESTFANWMKENALVIGVTLVATANLRRVNGDCHTAGGAIGQLCRCPRRISID